MKNSNSPALPLFRTVACVVAMANVISISSAQDLTIKAPAQSRSIAITGATIHPISSPAIENGTILFWEGVITEVFTKEQWADYQSRVRMNMGQWLIVDAAGKHVYPGLIAPDTQLGLQEFAAITQTLDHSELGTIKPEVLAVTAVNPDSTLLPVTRSNGILTAAVFPEGGTIPGRPCAIRMDGWTNEELAIAPSRATSPALGLSLNWPMTRTVRAWWMDQSEEDQQRANRESLARVTDAFDAATAYIAAKAADPSHPTDLRWEAMRSVLPVPSKPSEGAAASLRTGEETPPIEATSSLATLPIFIAANDYDQITAAIAFCEARNLRMVLVGGREADMAADLLKKHNIPVIISGTHSIPKRNDSAYDEAYTLPARLHAAGVKFCIASADRTAHERNLPYNAAMAVAHGLPMEAALASVTLTPAQILGLGDQLGSLEKGKRATLILTTGNPLEVTTQIEAAFIDGRQIDLSNKQTELYRKYRERFEQMGQIKDEYKTPKEVKK